MGGMGSKKKAVAPVSEYYYQNQQAPKGVYTTPTNGQVIVPCICPTRSNKTGQRLGAIRVGPYNVSAEKMWLLPSGCDLRGVPYTQASLRGAFLSPEHSGASFSSYSAFCAQVLFSPHCQHLFTVPFTPTILHYFPISERMILSLRVGTFDPVDGKELGFIDLRTKINAPTTFDISSLPFTKSCHLTFDKIILGTPLSLQFQLLILGARFDGGSLLSHLPPELMNLIFVNILSFRIAITREYTSLGTVPMLGALLFSVPEADKNSLWQYNWAWSIYHLDIVKFRKIWDQVSDLDKEHRPMVMDMLQWSSWTLSEFPPTASQKQLSDWVTSLLKANS